ncbi:retinol dehydrogenase 11-like [Leptidea sinapis]|uniref:retinol dehydrogenase 11-like n=1 Tax=Leptidea sinapis TaxID=189913 RepID=UPI0021C29F45|nr:retinol dehydrogenase 11-like [Leptidea sinapis]
MILIILALAFLIFCVYQKTSNAMCKSNKNLNGRTAIVTGGTAGLGFEKAKDFAVRGAKVIIACPFAEEGMTAEREIRKQTGNCNVIFKLLDLSSLKSIREFASNIIKNEERLDILVNNAGVGIPVDCVTKDGMHFIMQVNYYGHFLLTILLLPLLKTSSSTEEPARIVNMSSFLHRYASSDIDNYNRSSYWWKLRVYCNSKFSFVLFSRELSRRLKGSNVVINCSDPGLSATRIHKLHEQLTLRLITEIYIYFLYVFFKTPREGAQSAIYAAVEDAGTVSGLYFANCDQIKPSSLANDNYLVKKLWEQSVNLVKLNDDELNRGFK